MPKNKQIASQFKPAQVLILGFGALILVGSILLTLPIATVGAGRLSYINALFTATSAVCVTGLVVVDTGTTFAGFGQIVILILIQTGGLGIMTMATLMALLVGKRILLRQRIVMQEALNTLSMAGVVRLVKYILIVTFTIEGIAALVLTLRFLPIYGFPRALWMGVFHSISAFCNAGFDIFGDFTSLTAFTGDIIVNAVVVTLVVIGGIGFSVLADLFMVRNFEQLSLHTKLVLALTVALLLFGVLVFFTLEFTNPLTMQDLTLKDKMLASFFLSTTARTAGFNTVDTGALTGATLFIVVLLMFIGASPGGTGGGVKTTTFGALFLMVAATVMGKKDTNVFRRRLPQNIVNRAIAIITISLALVISVIAILSITEDASFIEIVFESVSAFATVGLSMGLTGSLSTIGRLVIIVTMFAGRLGPLTLALAFVEYEYRTNVRYPEEKIVVG